MSTKKKPTTTVKVVDESRIDPGKLGSLPVDPAKITKGSIPVVRAAHGPAAKVTKVVVKSTKSVDRAMHRVAAAGKKCNCAPGQCLCGKKKAAEKKPEKEFRSSFPFGSYTIQYAIDPNLADIRSHVIHVLKKEFSINLFNTGVCWTDVITKSLRNHIDDEKIEVIVRFDPKGKSFKADVPDTVKFPTFRIWRAYRVTTWDAVKYDFNENDFTAKRMFMPFAIYSKQDPKTISRADRDKFVKEAKLKLTMTAGYVFSDEEAIGALLEVIEQKSDELAHKILYTGSCRRCSARKLRGISRTLEHINVLRTKRAKLDRELMFGCPLVLPDGELDVENKELVVRNGDKKQVYVGSQRIEDFMNDEMEALEADPKKED